MIPTPYFPDLAPYPSERDQWIGLEPLAVGWLRRGKPFETGRPPAGFLDKLLEFCQPRVVIAPWPRPLRCPLDNHDFTPIRFNNVEITLGKGEIRVMGDENVYAAPDFVYHYVQAHNYLPPAEFIDAVLHGPSPNSSEFLALIRTLQQ